jgi:hypothetical protein
MPDDFVARLNQLDQPQPNREPEPTHSDTVASLDLRLIRALEAAPRPEVPADFAARLIARLPPHAPALNAVTIRSTHYGRSAILIGIVVLLAAMLILAGCAADHTELGTMLEWALCAQFVALTIWFTAWRKGEN